MSTIDQSQGEKFVFHHYNQCFNELRWLVGYQ